jgi:glycosyltransferase involved in cell wall biosynthesis
MVSEHASPLAAIGSVDAGGQNVHVAALARAIARRGVDVIVHTRRDDSALPPRAPLDERVWVQHVDAGPPKPIPKDELLPHMRAFGRELARNWSVAPPDVVHSHFWMSGLAAVQAARPLDVPVAHTFHALGAVKRRNQGAADTSPPERIRLECRLADEVDEVIATTYDERAELAALGVDARHVSVIPCGVDLQAFCPDGEVSARREGRPRVVVVSRLVERKGIGNVIEAMVHVPDADLVIAGGPPAAQLDADREARRFHNLADQCGIGDRVHLLGAIARDDVPALLRSADVVACCPWYEPFGLVAVEAMACGAPVVASAVGGLAESVLDGRTGVLVPPRSPAAIAAAIRGLLADEARCKALGANAVIRARAYGWDCVAARTIDVAVRLATSKGARRSA